MRLLLTRVGLFRKCRSRASRTSARWWAGKALEASAAYGPRTTSYRILAKIWPDCISSLRALRLTPEITRGG
jgi:hypothetical protein